MNIQISVVLWTVICFLLLILILQKLLFAPILKCIDAREKKISDAKVQQQRAEQERQEAAAAAKLVACEQAEQAKKEAERMISEERKQAETALAQKQETEQNVSLCYAGELSAEREVLLRQLGEAAENLSTAFVAGFVSDN